MDTTDNASQKDLITIIRTASPSDVVGALRDAKLGSLSTRNAISGAVFVRIHNERKQHPEYSSMVVVGSPEWQLHQEARATDNYKFVRTLESIYTGIQKQIAVSTILRANPHCQRCQGTGHIAKFQHVAGGVCFNCFPG